MKKSQEQKRANSANDKRIKYEKVIPSSKQINEEQEKIKFGDKISNEKVEHAGIIDEKVVDSLMQENSSLKEEVSAMKKENSALKEEVSSLKSEIANLKVQNSKFNDEINELKELKKASDTYIATFMTRLDFVEHHNSILMKKVDKLNVFLDVFPQYKEYFIEEEKDGNNSYEKNGKSKK